MKKIIMMLVVAVAAIIIVPAVYATPTLTLNDGINPVITITDGGVGDFNPNPGEVTFIGSVGVWTSNVSTGFESGTSLLPELDLNSINKSSGTGNLTITFSDTFNNPLNGSITTEVGGTLGGSAGSTYNVKTLLNGNPITALNLGPFGPGAFSGTATGSVSSNLLSNTLALEAIIHQVGADVTSFNNYTTVSAPEPGTLVLLGSGLLGLAFFARRRKQ